MLEKAKLACAIVASAVIGSFAFDLPAQAQVVDGTSGKVSRCDMHRALGRNLPPECGGTGRPGGETTRGRVVIGTPDTGTKPAATGTATPPASSAAGTPPARPSTTTPPTASVTPPPQPQPPQQQAGPKGIGLAVPFELNSDQLTPAAKAVVDQLAEVFKLNPNDRFVIEGHTDVTGGEAVNKPLSERRALAVINYLVTQHGLPRDHFEGRGMGSSHLLLPNDPTNGRNRRVQVLNVGSR